MRETVAVLGASDRPERVSYRAQQLLLSRGHKPLLVNPRLREIEGLPCYPDLRSVGEAVHTITVYLRPEILVELVEQIIAVRPQRVILNPGSESSVVADSLRQAGIEVEMSCTLILLGMEQF